MKSHSNKSTTVPPISDRAYEKIRALVYEHSRINLGERKRELVQARLAKRVRQSPHEDFEAYCDALDQPTGAAELQQVIDAITTNHTFFFREIAHFDFLKSRVLPDFQAGRLGEGPLRIWSAACSTGEEAYSAGITCAEYLRSHDTHWEITCTDLSPTVLAHAEGGIFHADRLDKVDPNLIRKHFEPGQNRWEGFYRAKEELRQHLHFYQLNLLKPPYPNPHPFHVIFLRNVMIYFDKPTQEELIQYTAKQLVPGGYLFVGHAESLSALEHPYKTIQPAVYQLG